MFIEFLRYCVVGTTAAIILFVVYKIFLLWFNTTISYSIGYFVAFVVNYNLTTSFTFKVKRTLKNGTGFIISNIINYVISIVLLNAFLLLGFNNNAASIITIILAALSNFIVVKLVMRRS